MSTKQKEIAKESLKPQEAQDSLMRSVVKTVICVLGIYFGFVFYTMELENM